MKVLSISTLNLGRQLLYSLAAVLLVTGVCFALSGILGYRVVALLLLVTVSLIAVLFEIVPVLLSALLSAFIWNFFFIPPRFTLQTHTTEDAILLAMYFIIALINGVLTYKIRQVEQKARLKEERANSVKLYNTILDSLSHELRTPIATILAATDNLQTNPQLPLLDPAGLVPEISKACLRLNQQVENLLNISRLESGHIQPKNDWCDITELVYTVVERVEENNPGRKITISTNPDLPFCNLDKGMLDQVLYNLLNNAAIHTGPKSRIVISATCHADLLEIIVEDSGEGFGDIDLKKVFHKFSRTKHPKGFGKGLGLSIVKGFTDALGGSVGVEKITPSGTRFTLSITTLVSHIPVLYE